MTLTQHARSTDLDAMMGILTAQQHRKLDVVAPASKLAFVMGDARIRGTAPVITDDGVTNGDGYYAPTRIFDEGLSEKLKIPVSYLRRMREENIDLYDENANSWLKQDARSFLIRTFKAEGEDAGVARAFLSDSYGIMDNLDVLTAAIQGINIAGVKVEVDGCDLTDSRMYVRIKAPEVQALAPTLLRDYRSPFTGQNGADNPTVFAGFVLSNSETGGGAFSITPRLIVQVCNNGMTMKKDAMRSVHLGSKQEEGTIRWTQDTLDKQLAVVTAKARDAVATFLDVDYMQHTIEQLEKVSGKPINDADKVKDVTKKLGFDEETRNAVFSMFVKGADMTAGGVMSAVTAAAQTIQDADKAYAVESEGIRAMELAAA